MKLNLYESDTIIYFTMIGNRIISLSFIYISALAPERGTSEVYLLNDSMIRIDLSLNLSYEAYANILIVIT